jgi:putative transcriptional regulator
MTKRNATTKRTRRTTSFRSQVQQSIAELQSIVDRRQSPLGSGRFTVRTLAVAEPSPHGAASVRAIRKSLNVSQVVFARLLGVSPALVRAWELGSRIPAPIACRLLDQVRANPSSFTLLVRSPLPNTRDRVSSKLPNAKSTTRTRNVA